MKILIHQFLGKNHSWSVVGQALAREFIEMNNEVDLFSTNGISHLPADLKSHIIGYREENSTTIIGRSPNKEYDMQLSYTAPPNWSSFFQHCKGDKNRFAIWCYETTVLPKGFAKNHHYIDFVLPPSQAAANILINNGIPEHKVKVIPHGVKLERFGWNK
jgi:glycosyltransferase involved in cell wall biosynthesis